MSQQSQDVMHAAFWGSPDSAVFNGRYVAAALMRSPSWLRLQEAKGHGPRRLQVGEFLFRKGDVVAWLSSAAGRHEGCV
jgi:hypothetical protein